MDRSEKEAAVKEIGAGLERASAVFAVDYRGISVPQAAELRARLNEADASFNVVKNRLAKRATEGAGAAQLDEHLSGPTALTFVNGDAVLAAKAISDFSKEHGVPTYKGGLMDGAALDPDQFKSIAALPGVDVLRGRLVGMAASPLTGIVRSMNGLLSGLASQLGQVAEQGLVGGDAPPEAEGDGAEAEGDGADEAKGDADAKDDDTKDAADTKGAADAKGEGEAEPDADAGAEAAAGDAGAEADAGAGGDDAEAEASSADETTSETDDQTSDDAEEAAGDDKEDD